ncbi:MAG: hypothetical protein AAFR27_06095, partial [Pseudomonadota bacterium]
MRAITPTICALSVSISLAWAEDRDTVAQTRLYDRQLLDTLETQITIEEEITFGTSETIITYPSEVLKYCEVCQISRDEERLAAEYYLSKNELREASTDRYAKERSVANDYINVLRGTNLSVHIFSRINIVALPPIQNARSIAGAVDRIIKISIEYNTDSGHPIETEVKLKEVENV